MKWLNETTLATNSCSSFPEAQHARIRWHIQGELLDILNRIKLTFRILCPAILLKTRINNIIVCVQQK